MIRTRRAGLFAVAFALLIGGAGARSAEAQHSWWTDRAPADVRAEEFYENIQVMNGKPADQIRASMSALEATLGVHCGYCHVSGDNAADTPLKQTARRMMRMVRDINETTFGGRNVITCATCHAGSTQPATFAPVGGGRQMPPEIAAAGMLGEETPLEGDTPAVDQLIDRYLAAVGGPQAVQGITSLTGSGTFTNYGHLDVAGDHRTRNVRDPTPFALFVKDQNQRSAVIQLNRGDLIATQDGDSGWTLGGFFGSANLPARDMAGDEVDASRLQNAALFPMQLRELVQEMRVTGTATVGGQPTTVVTGRTNALPVVKLYFGQNSGLLANIQYWIENDICCRRVFNILLTDRTDLAESGVRVPRRWIVTSDRDTFHEYRLETLELNTAVDDAVFVKPEPPPGA